MNIKLSLSLIAITSVLYGCAATPSLIDPNPVITENGDKVISDGSHLKSVPMSRDFITNSKRSEEIQASFKEKGSKGSEKIFSIKPTGTT